MRPKDVKRAIESLYPVRRPLFLWGPPGVGKSAVVAQAAKSLGIEFFDVRLVYSDSSDLRFPIVQGDKVRWVCSLLPDDPEWRGIISLEELPQCPPVVQAAAMQVTLDRRVGDYRLPDGAMVVAVGNRQEDRAGAGRVITPLLNRFIHTDLDVSLEDWTSWAVEKGISSSVISFLQYRPHLLHRFDPDRGEREFPTPRSWEFASDTLKVTPPELRLSLLSGCVGKATAAEFVGYLDIEDAMLRKYPIERILAEPASAPTPSLAEGAVLYALAGALAERVRTKKKEVVHAVMTYLMRLPLEFAAFALRSTIQAAGTMLALSAPGASTFVAQHKYVLCN